MLITSIRVVTPALMTALLRANGTLQDHEAVSDVRRLASSESDDAHQYQLALQYRDYRTQRRAPDEVSLKITRSGFAPGQQEVCFYSAAAPRMRQRYSSDELCLPACYDAYYDEASQQAHLLLDNLGRAFKPSPQKIPPTPRHREQIIDALARIHAYWWDHPELEEFTQVADRARIDQSCELAQRKYSEMRSFIGAQITPRQREIISRITQGFPQRREERLLAGQGVTLVHHDLHPENLYYSHRESRILGWQNWGADVGADDLAYMIGCFWSPFERRMHEKHALRRYHEGLVRFGVQGYSMDDLEYDYRASLANCVMIRLGAWTKEKHTQGFWKVAETAMQVFDEWNGMEIYG